MSLAWRCSRSSDRLRRSSQTATGRPPSRMATRAASTQPWLPDSSRTASPVRSPVDRLLSLSSFPLDYQLPDPGQGRHSSPPIIGRIASGRDAPPRLGGMAATRARGWLALDEAAKIRHPRQQISAIFITEGLRPVSTSSKAKRAEFRRLHESGCFVIPNPWDIGLRPLSPASGLQGAGDHQLRCRLDAGAGAIMASAWKACWRICANSPLPPTSR